MRAEVDKFLKVFIGQSLLLNLTALAMSLAEYVRK